MLKRHRRPPGLRPTRLRIAEILTWADAFRDRHGHWPNQTCSEVPECPWTTWKQVENALRDGFRGLPGGSSIAKLLAKHRGIRNIGNLPKLTEEQILAWADAHKRRTGAWPAECGGPITVTGSPRTATPAEPSAKSKCSRCGGQ